MATAAARTPQVRDARSATALTAIEAWCRSEIRDAPRVRDRSRSASATEDEAFHALGDSDLIPETQTPFRKVRAE